MGNLREKQLEIDARSQLQQQVIEIIKPTWIGGKLENTEEILKKSLRLHQSFCIGYFTAMWLRNV